MKNIFLFVAIAVCLFILSPQKDDNTYEQIPVQPAAQVIQVTSKDKKQIECLAHNIYYEAGYESPKGQLAVAMVTMKRVKTAHYPKSVCGVVRQKTKQTCQFSWWCEEEKRYKSVKNKFSYRERKKLEDIRNIATYAFLFHGKIKDDTKGALFYHNTSIDPGWNLRKTAQIGNHIFYKQGKRRD